MVLLCKIDLFLIMVFEYLIVFFQIVVLFLVYNERVFVIMYNIDVYYDVIMVKFYYDIIWVMRIWGKGIMGDQVGELSGFCRIKF